MRELYDYAEQLEGPPATRSEIVKEINAIIKRDMKLART